MKLFKKVMASVLAGVLALSMVACGTAVDPEKPVVPVNPVGSNDATILAIMNYDRTDKEAATLLATDADLNAKAAKVLDIVDNKGTWAVDNADVTVAQGVISAELGKAAMLYDATKVDVYVDVKAETPTAKDVLTGEVKLDKTNIFNGGIANVNALRALGESIEDGKKVGIATKTLKDGKVHVVIMVEK